MNKLHLRRLAVAMSAAVVLPLALTACSGDSDDSASGASASSAKATPTAAAEDPAPMDGPFGPACSTVPKDGAGSFAGMAKDPVATAASNNPALSTLVTAVKKAGLVDTLNNAQNITGTNFASLPQALAKTVGWSTPFPLRMQLRSIHPGRNDRHGPTAQISKTPSKANLKTKIIAIARHIAQASLFVLRDERKLVRNAIFERQHLILFLRKIRRIGNAQIVVDLPPDGKPCRRIAEPIARDYRIDLEYIEPEKPVRCPSCRIVDDRIREHLSRRVEAALRKRRDTRFGI